MVTLADPTCAEGPLEKPQTVGVKVTVGVAVNVGVKVAVGVRVGVKASVVKLKTALLATITPFLFRVET
jgi:hypothetical protein